MRIHTYGGGVEVAFRPPPAGTAACFLDRDGVLIDDVGHLHTSALVKLMDKAVEAVKVLNDANIPAIVISNQSVVARGHCSLEECISIFEHVHSLFNARGAAIDCAFFCPHFSGGSVVEYAINCSWRKPGPGMLLAAAEKYSVNLKRSIFVGDKTIDFEAAIAAGVVPVQVNTGYHGRDGLSTAKPQYTYDNLLEAVTSQVTRMK